MLNRLLSRFRKNRSPDDDKKWLADAADTLADTIYGTFKIQFEIADCRPSDIPQQKELFVACYVAGFCDVMAQATQARAGGNLSMTLTARILQNIFGNTHGMHMWHKVDEAMHASTSICLEAMIIGAEDANLGLQKKPAFSLAKYLSD